MTRDQNESIVALSATERALIDAYWRAANYLSVGQIYLYDNPLLILQSFPGSATMSLSSCSAAMATRHTSSRVMSRKRCMT